MILEIGKYATLRVVKEVDFGFYLDGGPFGEILLPKKQAPEGLEPEHELKASPAANNMEYFKQMVQSQRDSREYFRTVSTMGILVDLDKVIMNSC